MHRSPHIARLHQRIVATTEALLLQFDKCVEQGHERSLAGLLEIGALPRSGHVAAKHHAVVRRMGRAESHVGEALRAKACQATALSVPGLNERGVQSAETLGGNSGEQGVLVGKVPVERGARHAERGTNRPERQRLDAVVTISIEYGALPKPTAILRNHCI